MFLYPFHFRVRKSLDNILILDYTIISPRDNRLITRKGEGGTMETMTKEEMQRFLNREAENGNTEEEALKALADILGIKFPKIEKEKTE